jgi:hypothetical protein
MGKKHAVPKLRKTSRIIFATTVAQFCSMRKEWSI